MVKTTIQLDDDVREALKAIGRKGESYNSLIKRVLQERKSR